MSAADRERIEALKHMYRALQFQATTNIQHDLWFALSQLSALSEALSACQQQREAAFKAGCEWMRREAEADLTACRAQGEATAQVVVDAYRKAQELWSSQCFCFTSAPEQLRRDAHATARDGFNEIVGLLGPIARPVLDAEYREADAAARAALSSTPTEPKTRVRAYGFCARTHDGDIRRMRVPHRKPRGYEKGSAGAARGAAMTAFCKGFVQGLAKVGAVLVVTPFNWSALRQAWRDIDAS